ncbi:GNAT family N-acetyltransferase [Aurantiacibacter rhizosphaerae]|uniref:GNAT family N-acetyltransferase n=1 Tax=Aurantiacibacter rhizosphaerae TaxID=2691582 RepID=A0A844XG19_9SPHN|nr:GNAT family N-acetyltransferase [Aurantiacibacter rhizosphaerae]MWV28518.1 GNAT family N-acetyltransferase [Aurantiacibacter rhizosphaerae]
MFMRTDRLFLRPIFPEDWRDIYRGIADFNVVSMLARAPWPYSAADAKMHCRRPAPAGAMKFSITLPELSGAPVIGQIGIERDENGHELGYWIGRKWQRRGYASEAVRGVLDMAAALGVDHVNAGHFLENTASGKVLRSAGFTETGEITPTPCAARGGELVLARRYVRALNQTAQMAGAKAA